MLQRLAVGEASPQEALRLQQHLVHCRECARLTQELKEAACLLKSAVAGGTATPVAGGTANPSLQHVPAPMAGPSATPLPQGGGEYGFLAPPQAPGEMGRLGPYVVRRMLGTGGMGLVLEAEDPHLQRPVALKIMHAALAGNESYRERFLQEARAAAKIDHENIVVIYGAGEERGVLYLAMQLLRGETLEDRLRHESKLSQAETLRIGREVASGLAAAHEAGLVHRDIKPANIWLEAGSGRVKILDFGLARLSGGAGARLTRTGVVMGTPGYMAPEQARTKDPIDHRCDLFSLGCVLYHLCTGRVPFESSDPVTALIALATEQPPPPHHLSAEINLPLSELVIRLMSKKPADRPASARVVAEELARIERNGNRPATAAPQVAMPMLRAAGVSDRESILLSTRASKKNGGASSGSFGSPGPVRGTLLIVATALLFAAAVLAIYQFGPQVRKLVSGSDPSTTQPAP
jgi:serine/threonine protein kinase